MLKIKDNVDLKELEKYDFEINSKDFYREKRGTSAEAYLDTGVIVVDRHSREIQTLYTFSDEFNRLIHENDGIDIARVSCPNALYDLIKADLVEKVDE